MDSLDLLLKGCAHTMRLKYKKLIVIFSLAIMLIGLGTFSLIAPSVDFSHLVEGLCGKLSDRQCDSSFVR